MDLIKIMLVEDDEALRRLTEEALGRWDFLVSAPDPSEDIVAFFVRESPRLVILDVGLPRLDGFEWCARLREVSRVPILFLSARSGAENTVRALATGGDDWLDKPFETEVLVAKVKALLRRAYAWAAPREALLERGGLVLDIEKGEASFEGKRMGLSRHEARLLKRLMEADGRLVLRGDLMDELWSADVFVDDNTLTVNVTRLKNSLAGIGAAGRIETVRGSGYRMP
jgi:DNA-binding response OmpR family regulator